MVFKASVTQGQMLGRVSAKMDRPISASQETSKGVGPRGKTRKIALEVKALITFTELLVLNKSKS